MANIKISELPTASNFNDEDYTMIVQNGENKKITGANFGNIVASGNNANGDYIKFSDGTMICTKEVTLTANLTYTWGALYDTGATGNSLGDFAQSFIAKPKVFSSMVSANGCWAEAIFDISTTSFGTIVMASATSKTANIVLDLMAIGKWK